jgi:5-methylcytosine-specific restriction endonuclease McrA
VRTVPELSTFARALSEVVDLTLCQRGDEARRRLQEVARIGRGEKRVLRAPVLELNASIAYNKRSLAMPSKARQAGVFQRDGFYCRYCGRSVVALPVMNAVSAIYPTIYRLHPHWKASETDVSFWIDMASVDHVMPLTRSGDNTALNLVTACWRCNELKGNATIRELGWSLTEATESSWGGLSSKLLPLIALIEKPRPYFAAWARAFGNPAL